MLGQIPSFVRRDAESPPSVSMTQLYPEACDVAQQKSNDQKRYIEDCVAMEAKAYRKKFLEAQQFFQSRCQHHIHKSDAQTKKRLIPNACRCASRPHECKHEAPWTARMNEGSPLLVCKGNAEARGLRCSGARNFFSAVLPTETKNG